MTYHLSMEELWASLKSSTIPKGQYDTYQTRNGNPGRMAPKWHPSSLLIVLEISSGRKTAGQYIMKGTKNNLERKYGASIEKASGLRIPWLPDQPDFSTQSRMCAESAASSLERKKNISTEIDAWLLDRPNIRNSEFMSWMKGANMTEIGALRNQQRIPSMVTPTRAYEYFRTPEFMNSRRKQRDIMRMSVDSVSISSSTRLEERIKWRKVFDMGEPRIYKTKSQFTFDFGVLGLPQESNVSGFNEMERPDRTFCHDYVNYFFASLMDSLNRGEIEVVQRYRNEPTVTGRLPRSRNFKLRYACLMEVLKPEFQFLNGMRLRMISSFHKTRSQLLLRLEILQSPSHPASRSTRRVKSVCTVSAMGLARSKEDNVQAHGQIQSPLVLSLPIPNLNEWDPMQNVPSTCTMLGNKLTQVSCHGDPIDQSKHFNTKRNGGSSRLLGNSRELRLKGVDDQNLNDHEAHFHCRHLNETYEQEHKSIIDQNIRVENALEESGVRWGLWVLSFIGAQSLSAFLHDFQKGAAVGMKTLESALDLYATYLTSKGKEYRWTYYDNTGTGKIKAARNLTLTKYLMKELESKGRFNETMIYVRRPCESLSNASTSLSKFDGCIGTNWKGCSSMRYNQQPHLHGARIDDNFLFGKHMTKTELDSSATQAVQKQITSSPWRNWKETGYAT
ncbi:uncharacterized protein BDR25DRAFT_355478 [Lindgomyces ingoldianus]|uniref:Uncharacterized protein n=1 Tax=Lindgomyces ingoldianus TaxID=673940 RepID=A0ACB6QUU8_9PLEO|nr:uncharacterized protein BDR25DRAFT_355478 [Lindgomyces ingoldianus]KAF2470363.1 hypothetical protein BDR25DRAFT_355478 [Lindgomyces ingoldianus]